jgi:hypothetical protein
MRAAWRAALVLALVACSGGGAETEEATTLADSGAVATQPSTQVVRAELGETTVVLSADTIGAGPVTFQISNAGQSAHSFLIEGEGARWNVDQVLPGEDATLRVDLAPGYYDVSCPLRSAEGLHVSLGEHARLVVVETD